MDRKDIVLLSGDRLSVDRATQAVASPAAGGSSVFIGTTRDNFDGKPVTLLEYEAYESMAEKEMHLLCKRAREKWADLIGVAVFHRLGVVPIGEASVIIAVSSPHRLDAIRKFLTTVSSSFIPALSECFSF